MAFSLEAWNKYNSPLFNLCNFPLDGVIKLMKLENTQARKNKEIV